MKETRTGQSLQFVLIIVIAVFSGISDLFAQNISKLNALQSPIKNEEQTEIKELTVGDKVPDIEINDIINYLHSKARLSDFSGKIILIDFWGTTCASCIKALPKFDSLQKIFGDKLQVLTVTRYDTREKVLNTLKRFPITRDLQLPVILNDDKLFKLFPHEIVSHVAWIGPEGIVKAITGTEYVTAANIQTILEGKKTDWPIKKDLIDFDYEKAFLDVSQGISPAFIYYSALTGYMAGAKPIGKTLVDSLRETISRNYFNLTLLQLCARSSGSIHLKKLILEVKDPSAYILQPLNGYFAEWNIKNRYCYSITLPLNISPEETARIIREDLGRWLGIMGIRVKKENRYMNCLVLVRTKKEDGLLKSKGGKHEMKLSEAGVIKRLKNANFSNLLWQLNQATPDLPWVINETGIDDSMKVDMELNIPSFTDIAALRKELQRYGLDLLETKRKIEIHIITENGYRPQQSPG